MPISTRSAYLVLVGEPESGLPAGVDIRQATANVLRKLSQALGVIRTNALNDLDTATAKVAADYQLRVDFMILHLNQEIIDLIDSSAELALVKDTLDKANKNLAKIKDDAENLAKNLERAAAILGEFEKLANWVKAQ